MRDDQSSASSTVRQPRDVLKPSAFSIETAEQWALERAAQLPADLFRLTSFWFVEFVRQVTPTERKTQYTMRLAQSEDYGIAFGPTKKSSDSDRNLLGEDVRKILKDRRYSNDVDRVALVDLVMASVTPASSHQVIFDKPVRDKQALRSRLFADEAEKVLRRKGSAALKGAIPKVIVIGATVGIINALVSRGFDVAATDMAEEILGQEYSGVCIQSDTANADLIEKADLAVITGMTLSNRTLPGLMVSAKTHNTSTMIWAITGRYFGHYYIEHGVDCVIVDPSPFFQLPGPAKLGIWHREH
jgi:hypothetical protein